MKTDTQLSLASGTTHRLLQKLKKIKKQYGKEMEEISDSVSLGPKKKQKSPDSIEKSDKSSEPNSRRKEDNFSLRERLEAKKKRQREADKEMGIGLIHGEEQGDVWLMGGTKKENGPVSKGVRSGSLLESVGNISGSGGQIKSGSQDMMMGSSYSSSDTSVSADSSLDGYSLPAQETSFGSSGMDSIDQSLAKIDAEANAREEAERAAELASQQRDQAIQEAESQQQAALAQQQTLANSQSSTPEEMTFQPNSGSTAEISAQELEAQVNEAVQEALGDGQEATNEMLEQAELKLEAVQAETTQAQARIAKEAPKFSQDLGTLMERYASSDSRSEQELLQKELETLLDGAGESLQPQVSKIRGQLAGMFEQSKAVWESREAAQQLRVISAEKVTGERRSSKPMQSDPEFLKKNAKKNVRDDPAAGKVKALAQKPSIEKVLKGRGVTG